MPAALQAVGPRYPVSLGSGETSSSKSRPCSSAAAAASWAAVSPAASRATLSPLPVTVNLVSSASLCLSLRGKPCVLERWNGEQRWSYSEDTPHRKPRPEGGQR